MSKIIAHDAFKSVYLRTGIQNDQCCPRANVRIAQATHQKGHNG